MDNLGTMLVGAMIAVFAAVAVYVIMIIAGLFVAPLVLFAWNNTMPFLFGLPVIGYWHAFWLWMLSATLVKSSQVNMPAKDK